MFFFKIISLSKADLSKELSEQYNKFFERKVEFGIKNVHFSIKNELLKDTHNL